MNVKLFVVSILLCVPMNFFAAEEPVLTAEEIGLLAKVATVTKAYPPPYTLQLTTQEQVKLFYRLHGLNSNEIKDMCEKGNFN